MTKTKIQWADHTINPVVGCSKISSGCQNCYAEKMARRLAYMGLEQYQEVIIPTDYVDYKQHWGGWNGKTDFVPSELEKPYKWKKPRTIFVSSMGDLFHESVPLGWISGVMAMIFDNPRHTFILLTKRPARMHDCFSVWDRQPNIVLGVSVEDQKTADERIRILLQIPAAKRFVSIEPMLEEVDLYRGGWSFLHPLYPPPGNKTGWKHGLDGVVLGGESGTNARPLNPEWVRKVRNRCKEASVPFMFKQWGNNVVQEHGRPWEFNNENGFPELDGNTHTELAWNVR